jgi:N-formylglutamate deformylase
MSIDPVFTLRRGNLPLLVSMPHIGTNLPGALRQRLDPRAQDVEDTDWHLAQLYDFLRPMGASALMPRYSRYVIDLNRPPDDAPMYPGAANTELCPTRLFTDDPLYRQGLEPQAPERLERRDMYWQPYHDQVVAEIERLRAMHGYVLLWDAHSIRSHLPWLFKGKLPDFNIGSADGASADPRITQAVASVCAEVQATQGFTHVVNGRFKGGYITRHYGQPQQHVHALQLEICQSLYMQEDAPFSYLPELADRIKPLLVRMVDAALQACAAIYAKPKVG